MTDQTVSKRRRPQDQTGLPRRIPSQQRGRERFERILSVAADLIEKNGSDALKMSEIVKKAEVSFGSLYQYFPDKTAIIRTLAERFNEQGRRCVADELALVETDTDLPSALGRIIDGYYAMFRDEPVMRDIWSATQADRLLQTVDAEDMEFHSQAFLAVLQRLRPDRDPDRHLAVARLTMQLVAAAVRYAISLSETEGRVTIDLFKRMLPTDMERLLRPE